MAKVRLPLDVLFLFVSMAKYFRNKMKIDQLAHKAPRGREREILSVEKVSGKDERVGN